VHFFIGDPVFAGLHEFGSTPRLGTGCSKPSQARACWLHVVGIEDDGGFGWWVVGLRLGWFVADDADRLWC